jgi:hypothetical protein
MTSIEGRIAGSGLRPIASGRTRPQRVIDSEPEGTTMRRIVFALIASFSAFLLAATVAPSAPAATAQRDTTISTERTAAETASAGRLPPHVVRRLKAFEIRQTSKFRVTGKAITYRGKPVVLKKSNRRVGGYRFVKQDRTDAEGRFAMNFDGRVGTHFRIFLRATERNRATNYYIGRIIPD